MKTREFFLALAVAAAAIATSCVKEQIEEPQDKPEVEITGQVFEANHEVLAKSTLVDLTPTWVEGDKIYVSGANGGAECTFAGENKFQTAKDVTVASPYYAIYPAAEGHSVDRETGIFTVNVPAEQIVKAGQNVAAGALVTAGMRVEGGYIYAGVPAKKIKAVDDKQRDEIIRRIAEDYMMYASWYKE